MGCIGVKRIVTSGLVNVPSPAREEAVVALKVMLTFSPGAKPEPEKEILEPQLRTNCLELFVAQNRQAYVYTGMGAAVLPVKTKCAVVEVTGIELHLL